MTQIITSCLDLTYNIAGTPCSGHGTCNPVSLKCECDSGWTGQSDFINFDGFDCQTNINVIIVLWLVSFICAALCTSRSIKIFRTEYEKAGHVWSKTKDRPLVKLCIIIWICLVGYILMAFGKISTLYDIDLETGTGKIGVVGFGVAASGFYFFTGQLTVIQCKIGLNGVNSNSKLEVIKKLVDNIFKKCALDILIILSGLAVALYGSSIDSKNVILICYIIVNFWRGFTMMITFLQLLAIKYAVFSAFKGITTSTPEGQRIAQIQISMKQMVIDSFSAVVVNGCASIAFATYRPLYGLWTYFIVGQYILVFAVMFKIINLFRNQSSNNANTNASGYTATGSGGGSNKAKKSTKNTDNASSGEMLSSNGSKLGSIDNGESGRGADNAV